MKRPPDDTLGFEFSYPMPEPALPAVTIPRFDEPHDTPVIAERRLAIVRPIAEEEVSVEPCDDGRYLVALVKHNGGTRAHVYYTKAQLEMLMRRIPPALEVG